MEITVIKCAVTVGAHGAPWGKTAELHIQTASACNAQRKVHFVPDNKHLQEHFLKLVQKFEKCDRARATASAVEEELTDKDVLLQDTARTVEEHRKRTE